MARHQLIVGRVPRLLRDILLTAAPCRWRSRALHTDTAGSALCRLVDRERPRLLVITLRPGELRPAELRVLGGRSWLRVLAVESDGRRATLFEPEGRLGWRRHRLEPSMDTVRRLIERPPGTAAQATPVERGEER